MKNSLLNVILLILISTLTLAACSTNTQKENTTAGAVAGAVLGGIAGSTIGSGTGQLVAIGVGAIAGGLLGGAIGSNMDSSDSEKMNNTLEHNSVRKTSKWSNKSTGKQYTMTPMSHTMSYKGNDTCRKYYSTVTMDGKKQAINGIACKQKDGSWQAMN
ncbi:MAG TPA: RT0821/Lpp0805 family surface protein [Gammaproteobacteria bacterium]|nr:RT0821/Lpp0805 family surface protein [Gammaproteobacteria bacterium]